MGTLSEELGPVAERLVARPRIYADANVPAGLVAHMRVRLHWDVLFVLEDADVTLTARAAVFGATVNRGQTCLAVRRVFVQERIYEAFLEQVAKLLPSTPVKLAGGTATT